MVGERSTISPLELFVEHRIYDIYSCCCCVSDCEESSATHSEATFVCDVPPEMLRASGARPCLARPMFRPRIAEHMR